MRLHTACLREDEMEILLWKIRNSRNITLVELSKHTGISKTTLNNIENGKVMPRIDQLEAIARFFHIRITELFDSEIK